MKLQILIDDTYTNGIADALTTHNARPGKMPDTPDLTTEEFLAATLIPHCEQWTREADIAETSDIEKLRRAVKADPLAVKAAIEAKEAREAAKADAADAAAEVKP